MESVYIVFSATPYKMGKMIRTVLHNRYNHISLSFDKDLSTMYTFARFHENMPLYGGFVTESPRRYQRGEHSAMLKVCRVEMPEENYLALRSFVAHMESRSRKYIYNLYSAMFTPLHIRLLIRDSYTCAEFVGDALNIAGLDTSMGGFHSLKELEQLLAPCTIYEGPCTLYTDEPVWGKDHFPEKLGRISGTTATLRSLGRLTARGVLGLCAALIWNL